MTIVKATYTKQRKAAKASIRYISNRPGKDNIKTTRPLFGIDGLMGRYQAYRMIDEAEKGSLFFRFVISPDPKQEDTKRDLHLREVTEKTMQILEDRIHKPVSWVATEHNDHAPHRHVHVVAVVKGKLESQDFLALRQTATEACLQQRHERDLLKEIAQEQGREEAEWERGYE